MPSLEGIVVSALESGTFNEIFDPLINTTTSTTGRPLNTTSSSSASHNRARVFNLTAESMPSSTPDCVHCGLPKAVVASLVVFIIVNFISGAVVSLRLVTRWRRLKRLHLEDYLIAVAWLLGLIAGIVSHYKDLRGFGAPLPSPAELSGIYHQQFIFMQLFYLTLATTQASIALNYRSFGGGLDLWHVRCCNAALFYIVLGSALESMSYFFQCRPVSAFWDFDQRPFAKCYSPQLLDVFLIYGPPIFRLIGDVSLILIPLPMIFNLTLPRSQKIAIVAVLCITFLSIGANLERLSLTTPTASISIPDFLGNVLPRVQMWSNVEIGSAILCACAVTLKAPFTEFIHSRIHRRTHRRGASTDDEEMKENPEERGRMGSIASSANTFDSIGKQKPHQVEREVAEEDIIALDTFLRSPDNCEV